MMENPFDGLRPEMRSEHDEIRKGIFSRALRNLQTAPLAEQREWCKAIRATYTAAQAAKQKRSGAVAATTTTAVASAAPSAAAARSSSPAVGTKRTHAETEPDGTTDVSTTTTPTPAPSPTATASAAPSANGGSNAPVPPSPASPATTAATAADTPAVKEGIVDVEKVAAAAEAEEEESEASMKECIAAFLRSLLDRVVGMSLENLNVPALRILCTMVGIRTEVRNKVALYSTLASFYYTECEKLGKRVSRDTVFTRQVEQEVAMLKHVAPNSTTNAATAAAPSSRRTTEKKAAGAAARPASRGSSTPTPTRHSTTANGSNSSSKSIGNNKAMPAAVVVSVMAKRAVDSTALKTEKAKRPSESNTTTTIPAAASAKVRHAVKGTKVDEADVDHYLKYENLSEELGDELADTKPVDSLHQHHRHAHSVDEPRAEVDEGEIVYENPVFSRPSQSSSSSSMAKYAPSSSPVSEEEWSMQRLERKVASIVQLHDPVTVAIVVKKLAQLGYREARADEVVEQILRRFHDRQLIYYVNGIAYLM